jgi:hypothetical protein
VDGRDKPGHDECGGIRISPPLNPGYACQSDEKGKPAMKDEEPRPLSTGAFKSFVTEYSSAQEGNQSYQRKSLFWSRFTFAAVAAYTAVTFFVLVFSGLAWQIEKDGFYYSQRATVILSNLLPIPVQISNVIIGFVVIPQWTNVGNTYADGMHYKNDFQFSHDDLAPGFTAFQGGTKLEGPTSLGPKQTLNAGAFRTPNGQPLYFPQACFIDEAQGRFKYAHVWGWANYKDILRPEEKRITRYCWEVFGTLNVKDGLQFNHYLCDEGNCQDGACDIYDRMSAHKMPEPELCQPLAIPTGASVALPPSVPPATSPPAPTPSAPPHF